MKNVKEFHKSPHVDPSTIIQSSNDKYVSHTFHNFDAKCTKNDDY